MSIFKKNRFYALPLAILLTGVAFSLWQFHKHYQLDQNNQRNKFRMLTQKVLFTSLAEQTKLHFNSLKIVGTFFDASKEVNSQEFDLFSTELISQKKLEGLSFISWAARVDSLPSAEGASVASGKDEGLFVLKYIAPSQQFRRLYGLNLTSNQYLNNLIKKSIFEKRLIASQPDRDKLFILNSEKEVVAFLPIFKDTGYKEKDFVSRFRTIQGLVVAAIDLEAIFKKVVTGFEDDIIQDAQFEFWDVTDPENIIPLVSNLKAETKSFQLLRYWHDKKGVFTLTNHFSVADRDFLCLAIFPEKMLRHPLFYYFDTVILIILFIVLSVICYFLIRKYRQNNKKFKKCQEDNQNINLKLEKLKKAEENFSSTVSHELKTPLTAINTALEIIKREGVEKLNGNQKNYFQKAINNTQRLSRLVGSVLNVSRIESGNKMLNIKSTSINNIIRDVVDIEKFYAEKKGLELIVQLEDDLPKAELDVEGIDQVLTNLIENAIKFTEKGKIFVISNSNPEKNYIEVIVRDTGEGIEHKDYLNVFDRFNQLQKPQDVKAGGVGLGLAICKKIISLHNGIIWVDSEKEKGSSFVFRIPIYFKKGLVNGSATKPVLIVEDEKDLVEMIQHQLENEGYSVVVAYDGYQALEKIKEIEPGLIVLDINLPKMSGLEFYSKISTAHGRSPYPVLVMTARSNLEKTFKDIDVDDFLAKPFEIDDLINKVNHIFRKPDPIVYLISDSDSKHVKNISKVLKKERFEVVVAKGLRELRLNFQIKQPDFIILEYGFAGKSGEEMVEIIVEYLKRMREAGGGKTPIIVYSYLGFKGYRQKSIDAGADIYIEKPTDYDQFITALRKLKS